jgi:crossover junction endodeoxyribonuclease RuvC
VGKSMDKPKTYKILAIDPGYDRVGIAILKKNGKIEELIFSECHETNRKLSHDKRLSSISSEVKKCIGTFRPSVLAIEKLFFNKNRKSALLVAEARGVILSEAASLGLEIYEYSPQEIKIAVTGYGNSDKKQVTDMVKRLTHPSKAIRYDDEYDAIATGLAYFAINGKGLAKCL